MTLFAGMEKAVSAALATFVMVLLAKGGIGDMPPPEMIEAAVMGLAGGFVTWLTANSGGN